MTGQGNATGRSALRVLWYRWTAIVELFARRRRRRCQVRWQEYCALHEDLLRACRSLAGTAGKADRDLSAALEGLAQPWLTPRALERAEREVLFDLLERCQRVGRELGGPNWGYLARTWVKPGLGLAAAAAGFALVTWGGSRVWGPILQLAEDRAQALRWAVRPPEEAWFWVVGSGLGAVVTICLVWRAARS